jgi:NADPH:quinone reductase-like Zn-dependent oxidoreductase
MRGVWLTGHGGMDKLEIRQDIPIPSPGPRDVLIRVAAASVNNTDINTRVAWYSINEGAIEDASWSGEPIEFPCIQGADVCGHIVAVDQEVSSDRIDERVFIEPCLREANGNLFGRGGCDIIDFCIWVKPVIISVHPKSSDIWLSVMAPLSAQNPV